LGISFNGLAGFCLSLANGRVLFQLYEIDMMERTREGTGISLQCPECEHSLERTIKAYSCPGGHVELQVTREGCPVLKDERLYNRSYGGDFKEGVLCKKHSAGKK
jgi:hypothetical protein